jgi:hypothetical protein
LQKRFSHRKPTYRGIRRFKIKEIPFREDFPCHSTWKRCKHSGHFSRFRNIIGNFCIIKQKCLCNYVINISSLFSKDDFFWAEDLQRLKPEVFPHLLLEPMNIGIFIIGIFVSDSLNSYLYL